MGFTEAVQLFFKNYAKFEGRSRRAEYWWPVVMYLIAYAAVLAISVVGMALGDLGNILAGIAFFAYMLFALGCLIPSLAVAVRRLHDRDMSGWWLLIGLIPFGSFVLLYFFVMPGTEGPNKFGEDPKGGVAQAANVFE